MWINLCIQIHGYRFTNEWQISVHSMSSEAHVWLHMWNGLLLREDSFCFKFYFDDAWLQQGTPILWGHTTQPQRTQVQVCLLQNWDFNLSRVLLPTLGAGKQGTSSGSAHIAFVLRDVAEKPRTESIHGYREIRQMASAENKWTIAMSCSFFRGLCSDRNRSSRSLLEFWQTTKPAVRTSGSVNSSRLARHPEALL